MITVQQIDRLVVSDDAVAARLWPRLGPRVRGAYTADRDAWVVLRRRVDAGETLPAATLTAQHKVFAGWARALHAASSRPKRTPARPTSPSAVAPIAAAAAATTAAPTPPVTAPPSAPAAPALAVTAKSGGGAGTAVAGGLLLAGLIAIAARRKSA
jgi:hypothetical protein